tara:strand:- start:310 stop:537 length:228 start_codon:yes stop_codon:yes gene_type:complete
MQLTKRAITNSEVIVQNIFNDAAAIIKKYDLNPLMFENADGCADNLFINKGFYKNTLNSYEWRVFQTASLLIDKA